MLRPLLSLVVAVELSHDLEVLSVDNAQPIRPAVLFFLVTALQIQGAFLARSFCMMISYDDIVDVLVSPAGQSTRSI
jgi:hypothetical protein